MKRYTGKAFSRNIPFLNALQDEITSVIEFAEIKTSENEKQMEAAIERIKYGYRAVHPAKQTVFDIKLHAQESISIPVHGVYAVHLVKDSFDTFILKAMGPSRSVQSLQIGLKDTLLSIKSDKESRFKIFLMFEIEVLVNG